MMLNFVFDNQPEDQIKTNIACWLCKKFAYPCQKV